MNWNRYKKAVDGYSVSSRTAENMIRLALAEGKSQRQIPAKMVLQAVTACAVIAVLAVSARFLSNPPPSPIAAPPVSRTDRSEPGRTQNAATEPTAGITQTEKTPPVTAPEKTTPTVKPTESHGRTMPEGIVLNKLDSGIAGSRLWVDPDTWYTENWSDAQVLSYLGCDLRPSVLPGDLARKGELHPAEFFNDGTMISYGGFNEFGFDYSNKKSDAYDPLERTFQIVGSKLNQTIGDVIYVFSDEMEPSRVGGVKMMIGHCSIGVHDGGPKPVGYTDVYVAQFRLKDVNIQAVSENLTLQEFLAALESIVQ